MDPNTTLARLRELGNTLMNARADDELTTVADEMAELFQGLDVWLSTGGVAPTKWTKGR